MKNVDCPYQFDDRGRTASCSLLKHVRNLIEQVIFTMPGERVNRPDFGSGLSRLVFAPNSPELATAIEFTVQGSLQQWMAELIIVESVQVESNDSQLVVTVVYQLRSSQERGTAQFTKELI